MGVANHGCERTVDIDTNRFFESEDDEPEVGSRVSRAHIEVSARRLIAELFGYGVASGFALLVDVATLKTLVDIAHWHNLAASTVAFIAGAGVAYVLSKRYVFRGPSSRNPALEFCYFSALGIAGLLVNAAVLFVGISLIGLGLLTAKAVATICTFTTNFALRRALLFTA